MEQVDSKGYDMHGFGIYNYYSSGLSTLRTESSIQDLLFAWCASSIIGHSLTIVSRVACHTGYSSIFHARYRLQCTYRMTIVDWMVMYKYL